MNIFSVVKLLFTHNSELQQIVTEMRIKKSNEEREARQYNLNLCFKHKQEQNRSHFSENNCHHCMLLKELGREGGR